MLGLKGLLPQREPDSIEDMEFTRQVSSYDDVQAFVTRHAYPGVSCRLQVFSISEALPIENRKIFKESRSLLRKTSHEVIIGNLDDAGTTIGCT